MSKIMSKIHVSSSPHIRSKVTTKSIMRDVVIALLPATIFGAVFFGLQALLVIVSTCATAVLAEYIYEKAMKKPITTGDFSALVTGLLIALNLPATAPIWLGMIGSVFAIIVVKQLYGGLGQNFMNPALAARCFLLISFTGRMTSFGIEKVGKVAPMTGYAGVDGISSATPLAVLKGAEATGTVNIMDVFIGNVGGTIGETSAIALLIGAAYLLVRKVISIRIPLVYIATFSVFILLLGKQPFDFYYLGCEICGGGLLLGAFFMATDYVTSPITPNGKILFGIALGILTGLFRMYGAGAEGVSYAIIICNLLVPLIEKITIPKPFGYGEEAAK